VARSHSSKSHFWLTTCPNWVGEFSLAGAVARVSPLGYWCAAVPKRALLERGIDDVTKNPHWHDLWGDRRRELVFIGAPIDENAIREALDRCVIPGPPYNPDEFARRAAKRDPFPAWDRRTAN
jgi:G3E family GTPase